jgi:hypothetical protein
LQTKRGALARRVLTLSTTPWVLFVTAILVVLSSIVLPLTSAKISDDVFDTVVLVALAEGLLALYLIVSNFEAGGGLGIEPLDVVRPPGSINQDLLELVVKEKQGSLIIICYGSNRFGKVLDTVAEHYPLMKTKVMVCAPEHTLDKNDAVAVQDFITDMETVGHVEILTTPLIPTIRAAVLRDERGTTLWASASFYLIYRHRRALRSEGRSPVFRVTDTKSPLMPVMADFIQKEFDRLAAAELEEVEGSNAAH